MKYCSKCGNQVNEEAVVCVSCGCKIDSQPDYSPAYKLNTKRGLLKYILLSIITLGFYGAYIMATIPTDINIIASKYDGKRTMEISSVLLFSPLTLGIVPLVWCHRISARIGNELIRRGYNYKFGAGSFWGWNILGSLIIVGPFIYMHKLFKSMNLLSESYNYYG